MFYIKNVSEEGEIHVLFVVQNNGHILLFKRYCGIINIHIESNHSLDLGGIGEDITYPYALIEWLLRYPSLLGVRTGESQKKLTSHFTLSGRHQLKFDLVGKALIACQGISLSSLAVRRT